MSELRPQFSFVDKILIQADCALQTIFAKPAATRSLQFVSNQTELDPAQQKLSLGLLRVNHSGEVCAQALYQGQSVFARSLEVKYSLIESSLEENDHLNWCKTRVEELGGETSVLNPLWYLGSFTIGLVAGICGDKWSLGFIAETEKQVAKHLSQHLSFLPDQDLRSRAIVTQMKIDETKHALNAIDYGGTILPKTVRSIMSLTSKIMTVSSFYV